jgi:hypothetical protein
LSFIQSQLAGAGLLRPWPADRVERWPIERLIPYANNPRVHTEADVEKLEASIGKFGWTRPPLVDEEGLVIAGQACVLAAKRLGLDTIPVSVARGWSEEEKRAYRVADNQLAARATWDFERLHNELEGLGATGFDLDCIGFDADELERILAGLGTSGLTDPDSVPEVPEQPITRLGDIWLLGNHRVGCGDSTSAAAVSPVLAGSEHHLMIADPSYGVNYDPSWRWCRKLSTGQLAVGKFSTTIAPNGARPMRCSPGTSLMVVRGSRGDYHWKHEAFLYAVREGKTNHRGGDRTQTTV